MQNLSEKRPSLMERGGLPQPSIESLSHILHSCKMEKDITHAFRLHAYMLTVGIVAHTALGNRLSCILADIGCTHKAGQIFENMLNQSEDSWNSLITGYVKCGEPHHALSLYRDMPKDGSVRLYGRAFVALLNSCSKVKDLGLGIDLHVQVSRMGLLESDRFVGSALVDMYAKCGFLDKAQDVFGQIVVKTVVSWNSLIGGYADYGHNQEALDFYEQMKLEGLSPTDITYVCSLKACGNMQAIDKGEEIHAEIERKGLLEMNCFIGSALVDMYAKCGLLLDAQQVFDVLPVQDVVVWTTLIAGYVEHEDSEEALLCFEQMQAEGVNPNAVTFVCSLKACGSIGAIGKAQEIHAEVERQELLGRNLYVGSTLVDMYAKCGLLAKALQVFERLPERDVVSWTALLSGYAEHGLGEEALECFLLMEVEGVLPDASTFVCNLKACGSITASNEGLLIHSEIERRGLFERDIMIGNALVDMYAKCGSLSKAAEVFENLLVKDIISWNSLLAGYAEHGHGEWALQCLECMRLEGVSLDAVTFASSLKACGMMQDIDRGLELHGEVEMSGFLERNLSISSALIDMYTKCGLLVEAQQMFDGLPFRDILSWNALVRGYVEQAYNDEALKCFAQMQHEGVYPDEVTCVCILKACGESGSLSKGQEIHSEIERNGLLERSSYAGSFLVDMYFKCASLAKAQQVFDVLVSRDQAIWNVLVAGYAGHGHGEKALKYFEQMRLEGVLPDATTFICSLKACKDIGATDKGIKIHSEIESNQAFKGNFVIGDSLVCMYAENSLFAKAQQVFNMLPARSIVSWNALIAGYAEHGHGEKGLKCFDQMLIKGRFLDTDAFLCGLKACGCLGAIEKGYEMHADIVKLGLHENRFVGSGLVEMYGKCGSLAAAQQVFNQISVPDVISWNILMAGYIELDHDKEALELFQCMQLENVFPSASSLVLCLKACGSLGATVKGREMHVEIERRGFLKCDLFVGNALVDMYSRCGLLTFARQVFDKLPWRDVVSWNCIMAGHVQIGEYEGVFRTFDQLVEGGLRPDAITFVIILNACSHTCLVDKSAMYFKAISKSCGILPVFEHHACLLDLLGRAGQLDKAVAIIKKMPFCHNLVAWRTILSACRNVGNICVGKVAFEHTIGLDEKDAAAYVLFSRTYANFDEESYKCEAM